MMQRRSTKERRRKPSRPRKVYIFRQVGDDRFSLDGQVMSRAAAERFAGRRPTDVFLLSR
jgi:hypothetical protein